MGFAPALVVALSSSRNGPRSSATNAGEVSWLYSEAEVLSIELKRCGYIQPRLGCPTIILNTATLRQANK